MICLHWPFSAAPWAEVWEYDWFACENIMWTFAQKEISTAYVWYKVRCKQRSIYMLNQKKNVLTLNVRGFRFPRLFGPKSTHYVIIYLGCHRMIWSSKSYFVWYVRSFFFRDEAMAVDRLKGVVNFLQQCRGADDFDAIQKRQYDILLQDLEQVRQMNHDEAAEALSLLKDIDFTADMRSGLEKIVQEKVGFVQSGRVILQQWKYFPEFLKDSLWLRLTNPGYQSQALTVHLKLLVEHLYKLGLRAPNEETFAMLTTVLLLTDQGRFTDMVSLRSAYLSAKSQARQWLDVMKKQKEQPRCCKLQDLPKTPSDLDPERLRDVLEKEICLLLFQRVWKWRRFCIFAPWCHNVQAGYRRTCKFLRAIQVAVMFK